MIDVKRLRKELKKTGWRLKINKGGGFTVSNNYGSEFWVYSNDDFKTFCVLARWNVHPDFEKWAEPTIRGHFNHVLNAPE